MIKTFVSLLTILSLVALSTCCIHDQLNITKRPYPYPTSTDGRILGVADRKNLRIHASYYVSNAPSAVNKVIQQQLMPAVIAYYEAALKVKRFSSPLILSNSRASSCAGVSSTEAMRNGVEADLVLLVTGANEPEQGYIAYAGACEFDSIGRPVVGLINFNYAYGFDKSSYYYYQAQMYTTLHEIGHVLGFSSDLYPTFIDPTTEQPLANPVLTKTINGVQITILDLAPLTDKLRTYFDCPTLEGAYIEQEGGPGSAGSHFERRVFYNEFMTASDIADPRISEFYLALLEGTGWYTPDYSMAEPLLWGKDAGCDFLNTKCINPATKQTAFPDYFCSTLNVDSCSFGDQSYGICGTNDPSRKDSDLTSAYDYFGDQTVMLDSFADNCPFYQYYPGTECRDTSNKPVNLPTGEYFGEESSCFTGTLGVQNVLSKTSPLCLKKTCQEVSAGQYNVLVEINGNTVTCTQKTTLSVPGYKGVLNCPDPNKFCITSALAYCPRGCTGRGTCTNNKCVCKNGFYGSDCSYRTISDESSAVEESGDNKVAIGVGAGVGGGILLAIIGFIVAKMKAAKAAGAAGAGASQGGDARVAGQNIQTSTQHQNQPGQSDAPIEVNMEAV